MSGQPGRAQIDPDAPQALGICDRCGFQYNLRALRFQDQWAGERLITLNLLVCDTCYDVPNEQLRTIRLPPDPAPIFNARPENFTVDEYNNYSLLPIITAATMFTTLTASSYVTTFNGSPAHGGVENITTIGGVRMPVSLAEIAFTSAAAAGAYVDYVAIYDAVSAGTRLAFAAIRPRTVIAGDGLYIPAAKLTAALT